MALNLPSTLKLTTLKAIASKCGIQTSGTKPILIQRLLAEIPPSTPAISTKTPVRILSIDMGIRNLAYCILDVPISNSAKTKSKKKELPVLLSWHRLAVSTAPVAAKPKRKSKAKTKKSDSDPSQEEIEDKAVEATPPPTKESFSPSTLSRIAYTLLRTRLLLLHPTHILIERQRFRSMGSKHILEWTIRVNMFESILYAVLCTLRSEGIWKGEVHGIAPGKVGPFWVGEGEEVVVKGKEGKGKGGEGEKKEKKEKKRNSKNMKIIHKGLKMDLVRGWLEKGDVVKLGNEEVEGMARAYREKWDRAPGGRKKTLLGVEGEGEEKMGKLDDLADSLLQGMAWIEWEENKRILLKKGYEALVEP